MELHFEELKNGLNIEKYEVETDLDYAYRMVYSALGEWARVSACYPAKDLNDNLCGPTKGMLHRIMKQALDVYLKLWPDLYDKFYSEESFDPIKIIREILLKSMDLIEVGFDSRVTIGNKEHVEISPTISLVRGNTAMKNNICAVGLTGISKWHEGKKENDLFRIFGIPEKDCVSILEEKIVGKAWKEFDDINSLEIFDMSKDAIISSCWTTSMSLERNIVYMARKKVEFSRYEYMLIKKNSDKYFRMSFTEYEQHENVRETQRMLYALRAKYGYIKSVKVYRYNKYSVYYFWSRLPRGEDALLRYIGWPKDDVQNKRSIYIIDNRLKRIVDKMVYKLGMSLEERYE